MISTSLLVLIFTGLQAQAGGSCKANDPGMSAFCSSLSEQGCGISMGKCSWAKSDDDKTVRVVVEQAQKEKKCAAKDGYEAHEGFCNNQSKQTCRVHSLCTWE